MLFHFVHQGPRKKDRSLNHLVCRLEYDFPGFIDAGDSEKFTYQLGETKTSSTKSGMFI